MEEKSGRTPVARGEELSYSWVRNSNEDSPLRNSNPMPLLVCSIALLAVTVIYLFWRSYLQWLVRRQRALRERVAFLLWISAGTDEDAGLAFTTAAIDNHPDVF